MLTQTRPHAPPATISQVLARLADHVRLHGYGPMPIVFFRTFYRLLAGVDPTTQQYLLASLALLIEDIEAGTERSELLPQRGIV